MYRRRQVKLLASAGVVLGITAHVRGATLDWSLAIAVGGPLVAVIGCRFLAAVFASARSSHRQSSYLTAGDAFRAGWDRSASVDLMSGEQFEDHVAQVIRSSGLPVIMTAGTGDWGVDLIVGQRPGRIAIQCKRHSRPIGAAAVQEVVAGAPMQGCTRTMVVSNQQFTPAARRLAEVHDCVLVGGAELPSLGRRIRLIAGPTQTAD